MLNKLLSFQNANFKFTHLQIVPSVLWRTITPTQVPFSIFLPMCVESWSYEGVSWDHTTLFSIRYDLYCFHSIVRSVLFCMFEYPYSVFLQKFYSQRTICGHILKKKIYSYIIRRSGALHHFLRVSQFWCIPSIPKETKMSV